MKPPRPACHRRGASPKSSACARRPLSPPGSVTKVHHPRAPPAVNAGERRQTAVPVAAGTPNSGPDASRFRLPSFSGHSRSGRWAGSATVGRLEPSGGPRGAGRVRTPPSLAIQPLRNEGRLQNLLGRNASVGHAPPGCGASERVGKWAKECTHEGACGSGAVVRASPGTPLLQWCLRAPQWPELCTHSLSLTPPSLPPPSAARGGSGGFQGRG